MVVPRLLEGEYEDLPQDRTSPLEDRLARVEAELASLKDNVRREAVVLLLNLLHSAMRDVAAGKYDLNSLPSSSADSTKWEAVKARLSPRLRQCVDLLLVQPGMKRIQIAAAMKMDYSNCVKNVIGELQRQGLIVDSGGELSLKEL